MSFVTTIDTLQFSKRMQKAGFEKRAADELAEAFKEAQGQFLENIATKQDITNLRTATKQDITDLRTATKQDIADLRTATEKDISGLRMASEKDIAGLRKDIHNEMQILEQKITIKLGNLTAIGVAILAALIKL